MYNSAIDDEDYSVVSVFNDTLDIYKTRYRKFVVDTPSWIDYFTDIFLKEQISEQYELKKFKEDLNNQFPIQNPELDMEGLKEYLARSEKDYKQIFFNMIMEKMLSKFEYLFEENQQWIFLFPKKQFTSFENHQISELSYKLTNQSEPIYSYSKFYFSTFIQKYLVKQMRKLFKNMHFQQFQCLMVYNQILQLNPCATQFVYFVENGYLGLTPSLIPLIYLPTKEILLNWHQKNQNNVFTIKKYNNVMGDEERKKRRNELFLQREKKFQMKSAQQNIENILTFWMHPIIANGKKSNLMENKDFDDQFNFNDRPKLVQIYYQPLIKSQSVLYESKQKSASNSTVKKEKRTSEISLRQSSDID